MFCEVLLKVREVCLQYNFDEILLLCLALLIIFRWDFGNPGGQWRVTFTRH